MSRRPALNTVIFLLEFASKCCADARAGMSYKSDAVQGQTYQIFRVELPFLFHILLAPPHASEIRFVASSAHVVPGAGMTTARCMHATHAHDSGGKTKQGFGI
jgi:hypothetical protein